MKIKLLKTRLKDWAIIIGTSIFTLGMVWILMYAAYSFIMEVAKAIGGG